MIDTDTNRGLPVRLSDISPPSLAQSASAQRAPLALKQAKNNTSTLAKLASSEARFRTLVEGTGVILWEYDAQSAICKYVSPQAAKLGFPLEDWQQPDFWSNHVHPEDRDWAVALSAKEIKAGRNHRMQYRFLTAQGDYVWIDDVVTLDAQKNQSAIVRGVMIDITERKQAELIQAQLETQLRQAHKMEAMGTLAGGVAHDFNNILSSIIGYTEIARHDCHGNAEVEASLSVVLQASRRAKELIHQILRFSRQEKPEMQPVCLGLLIEETRTLLRGIFPAPMTLEVSTPKNLPHIQGDAAQLQRVLMNLATNAAHALQATPNARLEIIARQFDVDSSFATVHPDLSPGPHVEVQVRDNGCGMSEADLTRIFDPFFTTKNPGQGTGLGLSVVHGVLRSHHGTIRVQSQPGAGTTFFLYFPVGEGCQLLPHVPSGFVMAQANERILFIDDEPSLCALGKRVLERAGYRVTPVSNAADAVAQLQADPKAFDAVVTDLAMPGTLGLSLIRQLRALRSDLPILLTTGNADCLNESEARALGLGDILLKPSDASALSQAVSRVLKPQKSPLPT